MTVALIFLPFTYEGSQRKKNADKGIENLKKFVDAVITIPNDSLLKVKNVPMTKAFAIADDILSQGVKDILNLIAGQGINKINGSDMQSIADETFSSAAQCLKEI